VPELPEVETVRRGLQPVMEGEKIARVEARRGDLRFPLQKDFLSRLDGQTVTGLGRRAKYIVADLASGDVLLMHLGMSGSFRVAEGANNQEPGAFHHPRSEDRAHDISDHLATAVIMEPPEDRSRVGFGATVTVRDDDDDGRQHTYRIVGAIEAMPKQGAIYWQSPIALALHDAEVGDSVTLPKGDVEIVKIEYA